MDLDGLLGTMKLISELISGGLNINKEIRQLGSDGGEAAISRKEIEDLTLEMNRKLLDALQAQLSLTGDLLQLKAQIVEAERRLELQRDYEPFRTGYDGVVLVTKPGHEGPAGRHYICPHCAEKGVRSFLQPGAFGGRHCQPCGADFSFGDPGGGGIQTRYDVTDPYGD